MRRALYPGTFDPVTNGHLDILQRACRMFDEVVIGVAPNTNKKPLFTVEERIDLIRVNLKGLNARVETFDNLAVDFAREIGATVLIRGLRAVSDFEFEFQMTQMNRELDDEIETMFLMPVRRLFFTSSSLMKQISQFDPKRVAQYIPENVLHALAQRFNKEL